MLAQVHRELRSDPDRAADEERHRRPRALRAIGEGPRQHEQQQERRRERVGDAHGRAEGDEEAEGPRLARMELRRARPAEAERERGEEQRERRGIAHRLARVVDLQRREREHQRRGDRRAIATELVGQQRAAEDDEQPGEHRHHDAEAGLSRLVEHEPRPGDEQRIADRVARGIGVLLERQHVALAARERAAREVVFQRIGARAQIAHLVRGREPEREAEPQRDHHGDPDVAAHLASGAGAGLVRRSRVPARGSGDILPSGRGGSERRGVGVIAA
ncbi:MAG: hypothetical protein IPN34_09005 [Planctomycetes bacterium]|nr:hypothetical protein [Planctomycetota bacterium]